MNILKFPLQLIENLYLCLFDSECMAILVECWCCSQDAKKLIGGSSVLLCEIFVSN